MAEDSNRELHPAEHRAYRELYASSRQLVRRWGRLMGALAGTPSAAALERGRDRVEGLLTALGSHTAVYQLHGEPMALGVGARLADVRAAVTDRSVDTGMVMRFAVLDIEHVATLLGHLGELAKARGDDEAASFCSGWESSIRPEVDATRAAAVLLGASPDLAAGPLDSSPLGRAAHGAGWVAGWVGETVDRLNAQRKR
jgi:hypothetical protein